MSSMNRRSQAGQAYWRSLEEYAETDEFRAFMHREFPAGASELLDSEDRRHFLKIMGASMALAGMGLAGCRRWPEQEIAPYASRPADRAPGEPEYFATCRDMAGVAAGLLVTSHDGRPTKIEGNPEHPANQGATDAFSQAYILNLYDPDRSRSPIHNGQATTWSDFVDQTSSKFQSLRNQRGRGLYVLAEASSSPAREDMKRRMQDAMPNARWLEYEPIHHDNERQGTRLAFGSPFRVHHAFDKAKVIVSLDSDVLGAHPNSVSNVRGFANSRQVEKHSDGKWSMSRLYAFEGTLSLTGVNADQRVAMPSGDVAIVAAWLASHLINDDATKQTLEQLIQSDRGQAVLNGENKAIFEALLHDLEAHQGESLLVAGPRQPADVHLLVHLLNEALGNVGQTVHYSPQHDAPGHVEAMRELADAMTGNKVDTLVILGGNPLYNAPADLNLGEQLQRVETTIHLSDYVDETSTQCSWHVNRAHPLETWGDGRAYDGTYSAQQPLIQPLFDGASDVELLAHMIDDELKSGHEITKRAFARMVGQSDGETLWRKVLHDGLLADSAFPLETPRVKRNQLQSAAQALVSWWSGRASSAMEVVFTPDASVYDGRFANNGWMQELPDPVTKLTWDNAALLSVNDAKDLGVKAGDMIRITVGERSVEAPVFTVPGHADGCITLPLGYGRAIDGRIAAGAGFNFYPLRTSETMDFVGGARVEKLNTNYPLASTQDHHSIDVETVGGRGIQNRLGSLVREGTLSEYEHHPKFVKHRAHVPHRLSLFEEDFPFQQAGGGATYKWGMAIDLSSCIGCSACVVACQAENNIPIVGKDQVMRGREMHWLRVDRYFKFKPTAFNEHGEATAWDPNTITGTATQPVPCMQCENAPCEQVCPVAATVHDAEGLNVMVYNRCIGTRYCSNNCPYKVRRFNFFDFHRRKPHRESPGWMHVENEYYTKAQASTNPLTEMVYNPEVTLRVRGVMEKCSYCLQRLVAGRIKAKNKWVQTPAEQRETERAVIEDGSVQTACQQACAAGAIVFGDLNDPNSRVAQLHKSERTYEMLEELNVKPRTKYLARITNPAVNLEQAPGHDHGNGSHNGQHNGGGEHSRTGDTNAEASSKA